VAFEVSGNAAGLRAATHALRARGRLVVVAIHSEPVPVDLFRVFWRELELIGARVYERPDFERAVELLAKGIIPADRLISIVEPIDRARGVRLAGGGRGRDEGPDRLPTAGCLMPGPFSLEGRLAVVTGARRGIGLAIADALAAAGADIVA
jgi:hypothetical protein